MKDVPLKDKDTPLHDVPLDLARLMAMDGARATRLLHRVRDAALAGEPPPVAPRPVIEASWRRMLGIGLDPERSASGALLEPDELEQRRRASALSEAMDTLSGSLREIVHSSRQVMVVTDDDGRVLWREGAVPVLRQADGIRLEEGAAWSERAMGTNAIGTALALGRPVQVHSAEHFLSELHTWTCAASPVHDPRDGRVLGVVDVSGPAKGFHPTTLALVSSVARLAESELRQRHGRAVERLRSVAAPIMCRLGGRALAVDPHGWTAAVTGMPPVDRLPLPKTLRAGRLWQPSLGMCSVEPLPGGWLIQVDEECPPTETPSRVVLDLSRPRRWSVAVSGSAGSWAQELTPRHAELLYILAVHRAGRSAAELAGDVFGDPTRTVTVRAEMSRVRRHLSGVLAHRPYRFSEEVEVEVVRPEDSADLLPHSTAPAVLGARRLPCP
ncbi:GAF domain-containing protein [Streptomyces scopuliridis]|uniref:GAF domain-containing protein n=1 Tax=Streptomyces scopuliridis TaxID=452529 RepID=A0ACD4ZFU5_9ACTN|nr:GAF domain-containing protein [Streptomyces scopuliridis]WSB97050.1 GAF domain-containing protein [Streptomyces scopuliridis]WSC09246.1 GAF domain-containing protein [Streptomyces scopuliridis]